jgi:MFS family permease
MGDDGFGALFAVFFVVYGVLSPLGGWCADRFGRSRVILASLAVWSAVTLATAYAHTYEQLLATRVLMGVSEACYIPAALALIADYHRSSTRSLATGIHMSGIYAGVALGGMGGWMADNHGWSSGFTAFGAVGLAFAVVLAIFLRDAPGAHQANTGGAKPPPLEAIRALGGSGAFRIIALHWGLLSFTGLGFLTWMPTFLREHYHLTQARAGFTATAYSQSAAFLGVLIGGAWADRGSLAQLRGRVRVPMIALTLAAPFVFMASYTEALWFAVVCLIAIGFARGCSDANMMPILCQVAEPPHRATGYGILNFFGCCAGGAAAYLGGWLKVRRVDLSYQLMGSGLVVLVCGLMLLAVKPARRG